MMKSLKPDQNKTSKQKKAQCNSNKASKFIEKESINGLSLTFSNLPTSLCDFIPKDQDHLSHEFDFEISKNLRKLEKKDALTKQKSLNDLLVMFHDKDEASVISTLKFWPKLYNKLSLDEDKKVRELTQQLMGKYARICGKEMSLVIKQLLPTWIIAQSDLHVPAANLAKETFIDTFSTQAKQEKAYLLCWESIYEIISNNLVRTPPNIKLDNANLTTQEEAYIQDVVVNLRTIITLLPFIKDNEHSLADLKVLLKSKEFWLHFKQNVTIIQSVYLQLSVELLIYLGTTVVKETRFIASNVCECYRMIDNYHPHLISRIWTGIIKCGELLPREEQIWKFIDFPSFFLPRLIKLLNCAADGNISQIYSCMLPLFTQIPAEFNHFEQILIAMLRCCECVRVTNNECEANASVQMLYECSVYSIIIANNKGFTEFVSSTLSNLLEFTRRLFSEIKFKKTSRAVSMFVNCFINPLVVTKSVVPAQQIVDSVVSWIVLIINNNNNDNENDNKNEFVFCENLTKLFLELNNNNKLSLHDLLLEHVVPVLKPKIIDQQSHEWLIPYFYACTASIPTASSLISSESESILIQCKHLLRRDYTTAVTVEIICRGIATVFSRQDLSSLQIDKFLSSMSPEQANIFFSSFYRGVVSNIDNNSTVVESLASSSLTFWKETINNFVKSLLIEDDNIDNQHQQQQPNLSWESILDCCQSIFAHNQHDEIIISHLNSNIESIMDKSISTDCIDRLTNVMSAIINKLHQNHRLDILPELFIRNLLKLILCCNSTAKQQQQHQRSDLEPILIYLKNNDGNCHEKKLLIDEAIKCQQNSHENINLVSHFIKSVLIDETSNQIELIRHLDSILINQLVSIDTFIANQIRYSATPIYTKHDKIINVIHIINLLQPLEFSQLTTTIDCACILIDSLAISAFSSCHNSNSLLDKCENIHKIVNNKLDLPYFRDQLLLSATNRSAGIVLFDTCPALVLCSLEQLTPTNYSQWTPLFIESVDSAVNNWPDEELAPCQLLLVTQVLLPCAARARYLVQEVILAALTSYLSPSSPTCPPPLIANINRALSVITCLTRVDPSYFHTCFPLLLSMKPIFQVYIDDDLKQVDSSLEPFLLTSLLEFISIGIDNSSSSTLPTHQWEFVFCLINTLIKSESFSNITSDRLLHAYWLLKLVSSVTVALASVKLDSIIDEWDNYFSEPIFTAILDQFSLVSGDHTIGRIVYDSDLFIFYLESLTDAVSLCPVNILLSHNFTSPININDPIDLPKDFLIVFNYLLESMSSYSLSVQLAAYNCLLNLTEKLSELLLEQINISEEKTESLEIFSLNLPHKLLQYMLVDNLDQLNIDKLENQIVLIRCFLSWNIVLQLFSGAHSKLRAEIGIFLTQNDRCFDKFLNFCFTFMPKNPIVTNKKHNNSFSSSSSSSYFSSFNLIYEEPHIFSQCTEKRSKFIIYHLSAYIFRRCLQVLPNLCRGWWRSLDGNSQQLVDSYVRQFLTKELFKIEFKQLKEIVDKELDDKLEIKAIPLIGEVTVKYNVSCDQSLEQLITLPNNYPIGNIRVEFKQEMTVKIPHWKNWVGQMAMTLENQNGSIFDGVKLWKRNLDNYFNGIEECMICYSILHATKYTLPSMPCYQCKKKFHKDCMYKWFHSSTNPTCPNCRNVFYDGSQKSK